MTQDAYLVAVKDEQGVPTGYSRCSLCDAEFTEDPRKPEELAMSFDVHVRLLHGSRQETLESVTEITAIAIEEAIRKFQRK